MPTRLRRPALFVAATLIASGGLVLIGAPASAADRQVTDTVTLQTAITAAVDGDTITFQNDIAALDFLPTITANVTIEGSGFTYSAGGVFGGFDVDGAEVTIQNLSIESTGTDAVTDSGAGGTIILETVSTNSGLATEFSDVTIRDSEFETNSASIEGTGITVVVEDSAFHDASSTGLSVDVTDGSVTLTRVSANRNGANGISVDIEGPTTSLSATELTAGFNSDVGFGLNAASGATATVVEGNANVNTSDGVWLNATGAGTSISLTGVDANANGGEGYNATATIGAIVTIDGAWVSHNRGDGLYLLARTTASIAVTATSAHTNLGDGFALVAELGARATARDSEAHANDFDGFQLRAYSGGEVGVDGVRATSNDDDGIDARADLASITIDASTIDSNARGLSVMVLNTGELVLRSSTISNNDVAGLHADPIELNSTLSVLNSTISGNGGAFGPSLGASGDGELVLSHSTIVGSGVSASEGVLLGGDLGVTVDHSIVTGAPGTVHLEVGSTVNATVNHSLIGTASSAGVTAIAAGTGNLFGVDPELGLLADNGGPTLTHLPAATSPVVDAGDAAITGAPSVDQRGSARIVGVIDLGAVERPGAGLAVTGAEPGPLWLVALGLLLAGGALVARARSTTK